MAEEIYVYQIDLDEYFDHLKRTIKRDKNHSSLSARVALHNLRKESSEEVKSLTKRAFSFSKISFHDRQPAKKQTSFKKAKRRQ